MRYYSSTAGDMRLTAPLSSTATTAYVDVVAGLPGLFPFTLVIDPGLPTEEIVSVTALVGTTLTLVRGQDGSVASTHAATALVRHMATARDFREAQEHAAAVAAVHGVASALVGVSDVQTLTNKTLGAGTVLPSDVVKLMATQTLTGKSMDGASNTFTNLPKSAIPSDTVYTATAQTLTNKTLDGASNTLTNVPKSALPATTAYTDSASVAFTGPVTAPNLAASSAGKAGKRVHWGAFSVTTDGNGYATVTHGAGFTPAVVVLAGNTPATQNVLLGTDQKTATTFRVRALNSSTGAVITGTVGFDAFLGE